MTPPKKNDESGSYPEGKKKQFELYWRSSERHYGKTIKRNSKKKKKKFNYNSDPETAVSSKLEKKSI